VPAKKGKISPREAVQLVESRRETQRKAMASLRMRDEARGLVLAQFKIPADAKSLLHAICTTLRDTPTPAALQTVADMLIQYEPAPREQGLLDL
jgi:hypothetical protein